MHHQIKVFSCHTIQELEKQVNQWLTDNPGIEVLQFRQSESGGGGMEWFVTFTVLFKKIGDR
jgi:hypothetical protein